MLKEVTLTLQGVNPLAEVASKRGCRISVLDCRELAPHSMNLLLKIQGADSLRVLEDLKAMKGMQRVFASEESSHGVLAVALIDTPAFCGVMIASRAFCVTCPLNMSGEARPWKILVKNRTDLQNTLNRLEAEKVEVQLTGLRDAFHGEMLTPRQKEVIVAALKQGFFEFPRKVELTELAKSLSMRPSTLSEILRRAEGKIVNYYIESAKGG